MRKRSRFYAANIVLGVIFAILFCISAFIMVVASIALNATTEVMDGFGWDETYPEYDYENIYYTLFEVEDVSTECIGREYQGMLAEDGYQYHEIRLMVHNSGTEYEKICYINIDCEGKEYDDIHEVYLEDDEEYEFYSGDEIVPPGQTAEVSRVVQVQLGVTEGELEIYGLDGEYEYYDVTFE